MNVEDWKFWKSNLQYPDFWQDYVASFKQNLLPDTYFVFDCETTGLIPSKDVILSIGGVQVTKNRIIVKTSFEWFVKQDYFDHNTVKIHGIVQQSHSIDYFSEEDVIKKFLSHVKNSTLVGHQVSFDVAMINHALNRMGLPSLRNKTIDTNRLYQQKNHTPDNVYLGLDELCEKFSLPKKARHTSIGDAFLTAQIFQHLQSL